ncbi:MAG: S8 family serine peptidase [Verrucomicrobium sp.]|nr:S8 family serine peptidase [Verrucomicrobium sp.]
MTRLLWAALALSLLFVPACSRKKPVTKLDDLPRHTYVLPGKASDAVTNAAAFAPLAKQVRMDIESDLKHYQIDDKTTLKRYDGTLLQLALLRCDDRTAKRLIKKIRALEDKPSARYLTGLVSEARMVAAKKANPRVDAKGYRRAFAEELRHRIAALPWDVVEADVKDLKGSFETRSRNLLLGVVQSEIEPAVAKTGTVSADIAARLVGIRAYLELSLPVKEEAVAVLGEAIAAHKVNKPDIWASRAVSFAPDEKLTPVGVGIWDSGVDAPLYPGQVLEENGKPAYIAFDLHSNRVEGLLHPIPDPSRLSAMEKQIKGLLDIRAAVDSPEAAAVKAQMAALAPDQVKAYLEETSLYGNYAHGTHVAGLAVEGNPAARIAVGRISFDYHMIPEKPTIEQTKKDVLAYQATVNFFKAHHVRVVNMSWGGSLKGVEEALEANGAGKDAAERAKVAREIFNLDKAGLRAALESAPEILFVTAAGNSDNDVAFDEVTPSSFKLPNLLVVGAVDQAGERTSFTSFGGNVSVYADGFEVKSRIPGGDVLPFSGTSMAAPEAANLAAKLIALDPALTPEGTIKLIRQGADKGTFALINPKRSVELLREDLSKR